MSNNSLTATNQHEQQNAFLSRQPNPIPSRWLNILDQPVDLDCQELGVTKETRNVYVMSALATLAETLSDASAFFRLNLGGVHSFDKAAGHCVLGVWLSHDWTQLQQGTVYLSLQVCDDGSVSFLVGEDMDVATPLCAANFWPYAYLSQYARP